MSTTRDIVVVLGMHRSGTSLVAGLLDRMGVHMGRHLVPARGDNPRGFFENQDIVEIHKRLNRLLHRRPTALTGTLPMPAGWLELPAVQRYRAQLVEVLRAELAAAGEAPAGFKDPHTARFLPLWEQVFAELSLRPRYLVSVRDPAAVADSLLRRDGLRRGHGELLWLQHYLDACAPGAARIAGVFHYEDWFADFDGGYRRLAAAAGVDAEAAARCHGAAAEFAAPDLNHAVRDGAVANPLVRRLYAGLKGDAAQRDAVVAECTAAAAGFQFWADLLGGATRGIPAAWEVLAPAPAAAPVPDPSLFRPLVDRVGATAAGAKLRVCIVTYDLDGPVRNSGSGSEAADLAVALAGAGHGVTVLYVPRDYCEQGAFADWVAHYAALGVELVALGAAHGQSDARWLRDYRPGRTLALCRPGAFNVYQWLRSRHFDVVHGFDTRGALYYCLLAKRLDMHFVHHQETVFHVRARGADKLRLAHNAQPMDDVQELGTAYMERRVMELADVVTAAAPAVLEEYQRDNCALATDRTLLLPHPGCRHDLPQPPRVPITEIVFLGSLEPRKGLNLFVDAVTWLQRDLPALQSACGGVLPRVRFLGAADSEFPAREFLAQRTATWRLEVVLDTARDRAGALALLTAGGCLAVLTGAESRAGSALAECVQLGIPFLAADTPANRHVLDAGAAPRVLFALHPQALARALLSRLAAPDPGPIAAGAVVDRDAWLRWHQSLGTDRPRWRRQFRIQPPSVAAPRPLVSVCVAHFNRPHFLRQCLASIAAQTYPNIEVIVVDDGSTEPEAIRYLAELEPEFAQRGWRIVRQQNLYLGAVRNTGARHARGKYCLFMDDDNYAKAEEVETFVRIAERTGADILTCFAEGFRGNDPPQPTHEGRQIITQLGDNLAMGLFRNGFGDSNCFVLRDFFLDVGGNSEDYKVGKDDQEFFARSVLNGARLFLVPEALYWYRETPVRMRSLHYNLYAGNLRVMRPYLAAVPPVLRDVLRFAQGSLDSFQKHLGRQKFERALVLDVLQSESWRLTRPLRQLVQRLRGGDTRELTAEQVQTHPEPAILLARMYASASWQLTAPVRLSRRGIDAAKRLWTRLAARRRGH